MSASTPIQWCDGTVNISMGCDGCELWTAKLRNCYAGRLSEMRAGHKGYPKDFDVVEQFPGRAEKAAQLPSLSGRRRPDKPWLDGLPRLIFVSDMSDALSASVPFEYLETEILLPASVTGVAHRWLWLTKQPKRMADFSDWASKRGWKWPGNLWVGTSITTQATARARVPALLKVGAKNTVRFLSVEPQWELVDLGPWLKRLDWVIQGGESGPQAKAFDLVWARAMVAACKKAGVPYFLKQLGRLVADGGKPVDLNDDHGGDWSVWPKELRVRQVPKR